MNKASGIEMRQEGGCDIRQCDLLAVVQDLFSNKDDCQLDGQLQQAAVGGTLVQTQWANALVASRSTCQTTDGWGGGAGEESRGKLVTTPPFFHIRNPPRQITHFPFK